MCFLSRENINNAKKERSYNMKKRYFDICEKCGAHLDPGEHCDCRDEKEEHAESLKKLFTSEPNGQMVIKEAFA